MKKNKNKNSVGFRSTMHTSPLRETMCQKEKKMEWGSPAPKKKKKNTFQTLS